MTGGVPPSAVEQQDAMRPSRYGARDLVQVELHGFGVGVGQREGRAGAARRTDSPEQVGAVVALIGGLAGSRAAPGPLPHDPVLLADAGLVLEPDFDRFALREVGEMGPQRGREVFLNSATTRSSCAGWRGRALMWLKPSWCKILPMVRSW